MNWLEVSVQVDTESVEPVSEVFRRYVHGGVSIEQEIVAFPEGAGPEGEGPEEDGFEVRNDLPVTIKGYIPLNGDSRNSTEKAKDKLRQIEQALWHLSLLHPMQPIEAREVSDQDWQDAWKEFYNVFRIGKHMIIRPSWRDFNPQPDDVVVALDPGMAFGTGLHPTTQMGLEALEEYVRPGQVVLDVGTGSGILAIAAARLGAKKVIALDVDAVAVDVARNNVAYNGLQDIVAVGLGSFPGPDDTGRGPEETFPGLNPMTVADEIMVAENSCDVVVANIIARIIVELADSLALVTRPGGIVITGGIIDEKCALVKDGLRAPGLQIVAERHSGDWVTLIAQKPRI